MTAFLKNDVIHMHDGRNLRLLNIDATRGAAYLIQLGANLVDPMRWELAALRAAVDDTRNRVESATDGDDEPIVPRQKDRNVRDRAWLRIQDIVRHPDVWEQKTRVPLLRAHSLKCNVSTKTLLRDLRLWWSGGQIREALLGSYHRCGRIEESTAGVLAVTRPSESGDVTVLFAAAGKKARGRRPENKDYTPYAISAEMRARILEVAEKHYLEDSFKSVHGATTQVLARLFSVLGTDGKPLRERNGVVLRPLGQRPSANQVRYLLKKSIPVSTAYRSRHSSAAYDNNVAPATGSVLDDCLGPADIFEIDSTNLDVHVVSKADRNVVIGKPTFYVVIDRFSRLISGFYLTLEAPSWLQAKQAILSMAGNWEKLCHDNEIPYEKGDWPAHKVMPNRFFADRGDMISQASDVLCDGVDVQVTNAPALKSRAKPIVESSFKSLGAFLSQHVPGFEPPGNPYKRRKYHYDRDACLTLDELHGVILKWVIQHNNTAKPGYQASQEEILQGVSTAPVEIWTRAIESRMGAVSAMPVKLLRRKLMPREMAKVRKDGIHFRGCVYDFDTSIREWGAVAGLKPFDVEITYEPGLVDKVIVLDPKDDRCEYILGLTTTSSEFTGQSFKEVEFVTNLRKSNMRDAKRQDEGKSAATCSYVNTIVEKALAAKAATANSRRPGTRAQVKEEFRSGEASDRRNEAHALTRTGTHIGASVHDFFEEMPAHIGSSESKFAIPDINTQHNLDAEIYNALIESN